jgi:hypothetical protein
VSGTVITNTAGVVTQAMLSTNVAGNGPAGSMYLTTAYAAPTSPAKVTGFTSSFNYGAMVDTVNNRLNITVAGVYVVIIQSAFTLTADVAIGFLFKNGANIQTGQPAIGAGFGCKGFNVSILNLSIGDYLEMYVQRGGTACNIVAGDTYISAAMVRSA